jgi:hypothetical protein
MSALEILRKSSRKSRSTQAEITGSQYVSRYRSGLPFIQKSFEKIVQGLGCNNPFG